MTSQRSSIGVQSDCALWQERLVQRCCPEYHWRWATKKIRTKAQRSCTVPSTQLKLKSHRLILRENTFEKIRWLMRKTLTLYMQSHPAYFFIAFDYTVVEAKHFHSCIDLLWRAFGGGKLPCKWHWLWRLFFVKHKNSIFTLIGLDLGERTQILRCKKKLLKP